MKRLVLAAAAVLATGCTVAGPRAAPPDAVAPVLAAEPGVRVGLQVDASTVRVATTGAAVLVDEGGDVRARGSGPWSARAEGETLVVSGPGETVRVERGIVVRPDGDARLRIGDRTYRGAILLQPGPDGVTAVNLLDLEAYLLGVVPLEIGAGRSPDELEAVKAQAIAARTYAVRHLGRRDALGFDFYASVMDQVYGGAGAEDPVASQAVRETRGQVVVYDGEPIEAYYHSTCGGRTAALDEVWPGDAPPYLQSVSDRRPGGGWFCESSSRFRWTEHWDAAGLESTLTRSYADRGVATGSVNRVESIEVTGRTPSGRAEAVRIRTNLGEHVVHGDSIRWILRPTPDRILNSSAIAFEPDVSGGRVTGLTVEGAGWGHGIGMCQVGALGRSRAGHSYRDILLTYYPGTRIAPLYP